MNSLKKYLDIALTVTSEASEYLLKHAGRIKKQTHKTEHHFGIKEDVELNSYYVEKFKKLTPDTGLYTEEGEKNLEKELTWVVDPIEGTSNYRVGIPFYATQVALLYKKEPVVAVVRIPAFNQIFYATKNGGAFLNDNKIMPSSIDNLSLALISIGKGIKQEHLLWYGGIMKQMMGRVRTFRALGACGIEMSYAASGMIDIFISKGSNRVYDYSPGALIAKEAGASVTDFSGNNWNINEDSIVVSNKSLHKSIIGILKN